MKTITKRIIVKHPDGTQKIIHQQITTPITQAEQAVQEPIIATPQKPEPQKVQIFRGPDGKVSCAA
jgi:nucleosome-remodeling factor subunit BPTF